LKYFIISSEFYLLKTIW